MALDFDFRDPKNQRLIATYLIPVVMLAAFYHFLIRPRLELRETRQTELAQVRRNVARLNQIRAAEDELEAEKEALTVKLSELEALLPEEDNIPVLINQFSMIEKDTNVYLVGFNAQQSVEGGDRPYRENNYQLTLEAGYHQFAAFIARLMALPRIMSFSDLRITMNPLMTVEDESYEGMENQPRHLKIECILTTYLYRPTNEESGG